MGQCQVDAKGLGCQQGGCGISAKNEKEEKEEKEEKDGEKGGRNFGAVEKKWRESGVVEWLAWLWSQESKVPWRDGPP